MKIKMPSIATVRFAIAAFLSLTLSVPVVQADQPEDKGALFGVGSPVGPQELPPGRVRSKIESLPPTARQRALEWLQAFSFSEEDLEYIHVDDQGGIFYVDTRTPDQRDAEGTTTAPAEPTFEGISQAQAFALHSRPGAANVVVVDVDGHVITNTAWNDDPQIANTLNAEPYDTDGNPGSFSATELEEIAEIWHRIAEDFAPFDIDVTTEEPATITGDTGRILITRTVDANGNDMPHKTAGGVAYVGVWGESYYGYYSPALVYYDNLGGGWPPYVSEASSHELGHNLALSHDGAAGTSYYDGHGSGYVSWAPIMGVGYYTNVTQWSKGEYTRANNKEDDLAIISGYLTYRPDDHGDSRASASALLPDASGNIDSTNPETDPNNLYSANKGVIERNTDTDYFSFNAGSGQINLLIEPAWVAYYQDLRRGANLDIHAALYDADGNLLAEDDPLDDTDANIVVNVGGGTYFLAITGVGNSVSPYSDYGSIGQYFISGSIPSGEPNIAPIAADDSGTGDEDNAIVVSVLDNDSDEDGDTLSVSATVNGSNGSVATDGTTVTYTPNANFNGSDSFTYTASDGRGGSDSATVNVTVTAVNDVPEAVDDNDTTDQDTAVIIAVLGNDSDADGDNLTVVSVTQGANGSVVTDGTTVTYTPNSGYGGSDEFSYTISDGNGGSDSATVTVSVALSPPVAPTGVTGVDQTDGTALVSWSHTGDDEDGFEVERETKHPKNGKWVSSAIVTTTGANVYSYTDNSDSGTFRYRVRAFNDAGYSNWSQWSADVVVTGGSGGSGGNGGGGNGGGKGRNK